jgi:predicted alpha-1,6-mannanase (GH76 family)
MFNIKKALSAGISMLPLTTLAITSPYLSRVLNATDVLNNEYYNQTTGLWEIFWWNSGAILSTVGDIAILLPEYKSTAEDIFANTLVAARALNNGNFLNEYYDDEGWWAMGLIKAYDVTRDVKYLVRPNTVPSHTSPNKADPHSSTPPKISIPTC